MNAQVRNSSPLIHIEHLTLQLPPSIHGDAVAFPVDRAAAVKEAQRYTKIGDDLIHLPDDATGHKAVLDSKFGIYRAVGVWPDAINAAATEERIAELNASGYLGLTTWRQPTLEEEFGIADHTKWNPACDKAFFPDVQPTYYRTSTPDPEPDSSYVFAVLFYRGGVGGLARGNLAFCRPVASVPARQ
ncbi:DUF1566 domain-containing protein [Dyella mobilis]|uniref:DUF1566 domain-containing protein n=1 Tax=Dyella mobilis TaxID=1849582 RepID=A0ABS2KKA4_9GAMM|nr:DUF1566 domain-containing protein [Dyella mobilis]MBM7131597.1 DUF1566 domain-containing protein [Dyella mobilis]GLQ96428.1 hypothetical protein GCM10007863_08460 [Dyella mobilis]